MCSLCTNLCSPVEKRSKEGIQFIESKTTLSLLHQAPYQAVSSKRKIFGRASDTLLTRFWAFSRACLKKQKQKKKQERKNIDDSSPSCHAINIMALAVDSPSLIYPLTSSLWNVEGISVSLVCATCRITKFFIFGFDCTQFTYGT